MAVDPYWHRPPGHLNKALKLGKGLSGHRESSYP